MRLIDVDALKAKEQYIPCRNDLLFHGVTAATIDAMPVVEARPIVYSKWIANPHRLGFCICEKCKCEKVECQPFYTSAASLRFCPNCGAIMDGGKNHA